LSSSLFSILYRSSFLSGLSADCIIS
jgi:hypothetical protein